MSDGTLHSRHLAERIAFERHAQRQAHIETPDLHIVAHSPAGRRHLRGIPCVGTGGLDERRDPLLELLDREHARTTRDAIIGLT